MKLVTCRSCTFISFEISRKDAEKYVKDFNKFFNSLTEESKFNYGSKASIKQYKRCSRCNGSYKNFRDSEMSECPFGATIQPIMNRKD